MLITIKPVLLRTVTELLLHKPTNLSEVEMTRGVKHVSKILIKVKYVLIIKDEVIFIQALIIQLYSQDYILTSKILVTKCNNKYVEMWNAYLSSLLLIGTISLINLSVKDRISDFVLRIGDPLTQEIGINTKRLLTLVWLIYILPKGDGVTVVPFITILREGIQELVFNRIRTSVVNLSEKLEQIRQIKDGINTGRELRHNNVYVPGKAIKTLPSQINQQTKYTSLATQLDLNLKMSPLFITGFIDDGGSFIISVIRNQKLNLGWRVQLFFSICLHKKDKSFLEKIKNYFGGAAKIYAHSVESILYNVTSIKSLQVIIAHFYRFPLISQKQADFFLWKSAYDIFKNQEHLTKEGLAKLVSMKAYMNIGLFEELKTAFPHVIPVKIPLVTNIKISDPLWLPGSTSGEGCFMVNIQVRNDYSLGFYVYLEFQLTHHKRDEALMRILIKFFDCGGVKKKREAFDFRVTKLSNLQGKIIPFFKIYKIQGVKSKDFEDFCKWREIMKNKRHLTSEVLDKIKIIKKGMNTRRWSNQIKIFSKPMNQQVRLYTTKVIKQELVDFKKKQPTLNINPWFLTGFIDGEGCFLISIYKDNRNSTGWRVQLWFKIGLHIKDQDVLKEIRNYLGVGCLSVRGSKVFEFYAFSIEDLSVIINHFDKYPLLTQKLVDFEFFKLAFNIVINKEHLTQEGLKKLVAIKASMNRENISDGLKSAFPNITPVTRSFVSKKITDPNWVAGFISGEGCFMIKILKSSSNRTGIQIIFVLQITQHIRDDFLMSSLIEFFGCGKTYRRNNAVDFRVTKFTDVTGKIIPFLIKYPIIGAKYQDYLDWCAAVKLMENKEHLTFKGLNKIKIIKEGINTGRGWRQNVSASKTSTDLKK